MTLRLTSRDQRIPHASLGDVCYLSENTGLLLTPEFHAGRHFSDEPRQLGGRLKPRPTGRPTTDPLLLPVLKKPAPCFPEADTSRARNGSVIFPRACRAGARLNPLLLCLRWWRRWLLQAGPDLESGQLAGVGSSGGGGVIGGGGRAEGGIPVTARRPPRQSAVHRSTPRTGWRLSLDSARAARPPTARNTGTLAVTAPSSHGTGRDEPRRLHRASPCCTRHLRPHLSGRGVEPVKAITPLPFPELSTVASAGSVERGTARRLDSAGRQSPLTKRS